MKKSVVWILVSLVGVAVIIIAIVMTYNRRVQAPIVQGPIDNIPADRPIDRATSTPEKTDSEPSVVAQNLDVPWEIAFLPDGDLFITERSGTLRRIGSNPQSIKIEGVVETGEGGLLGLALHPDYENNGDLYLYMTVRQDGQLINRVVRYNYDGQALVNPRTILDKIPAGNNHNGGRIKFGPDGNLYITTGETGRADLAQDKESLAGKILRVKDDGSIPSDNPFQSAVWSYGHRNPQGLVWDEERRLWSVEHGRSGALSGYDELNLIIAGHNYGWPDNEGDEVASDTDAPQQHSGATTTWAPGSIVYLDGQLFFTGLRGNAIYRSTIQAGKASTPIVNLSKQYGRLRALAIGPDGNLYFGTSNRDGRGDVKDGDDQIIKLSAEALQ